MYYPSLKKKIYVINEHFFIFIFIIFLKILLLLFKYSFLPFPPTLAQHLSPLYLPPLFPHPLPIIVHVSFIIVPANPSPFSPEIPSLLPSGHCQPVLNFSVFAYILLVCLFC